MKEPTGAFTFGMPLICFIIGCAPSPDSEKLNKLAERLDSLESQESQQDEARLKFALDGGGFTEVIANEPTHTPEGALIADAVQLSNHFALSSIVANVERNSVRVTGKLANLSSRPMLFVNLEASTYDSTMPDGRALGFVELPVIRPAEVTKFTITIPSSHPLALPVEAVNALPNSRLSFANHPSVSFRIKRAIPDI